MNTRSWIALLFLLLIPRATLLYPAFVTRNFNEILGDTLPATCLVGDQAFKTDEQIGEELYLCTSTDNWTPQGFTPAFGELYEDSAGTVINLPTADNFVQWVSSTVGLSSLTTPSAASDNITILTNGAGTYKVSFSASFSGTVNSTFHWSVFLGGVEQENVSVERKIGAAADIGSIAASGLLALSVAEVVDLRASATANTKTVTVNHANLTITKIGR